MQVTASEAKNRVRSADLEAAEHLKSLAKPRRDFTDTHQEWIASQNELVERMGVFGEEFRPW
jgi:hypothetical protein